jgi:glycosyltransferase involved in cell wall biosynthesis
MAQQLRILLLIPHLGGGGAEQVTALLARGLSREKYELHLGLVTQANADDGDVPHWVTVHALDAPRVRSGAFRLLKLVRRLKPDLILSGMAHLNFLVILLRPLFPPKTRVLVRQNSTVSSDLTFARLPVYTRLLYQQLYRHADRIICQSNAMAEDLARQLEVGEDQIAVLPNPVDLDRIWAAADAPGHWTGPGPHLLAIGRLSPEKGFDLLLHALSIVRKSFPQADLAIAGAGPEQMALQSVCGELGLEAAVRFAGHVRRPYVLFPGAALFVLSSRYEGLPNALLEAAGGGLPIVALPASKGVVDLLDKMPGAWLAKDVSASALAVSLLEALRALQPGQRFSHSFLPRCPSVSLGIDSEERSTNPKNFSFN